MAEPPPSSYSPSADDDDAFIPPKKPQTSFQRWMEKERDQLKNATPQEEEEKMGRVKGLIGLVISGSLFVRSHYHAKRLERWKAFLPISCIGMGSGENI